MDPDMADMTAKNLRAGAGGDAVTEQTADELERSAYYERIEQEKQDAEREEEERREANEDALRKDEEQRKDAEAA
jgi:hypothetical protein